MSQQILDHVESNSLKTEIDKFEIGDTVDVHNRILEGNKERTQVFNGVVIARSGAGSREMFTVRRIVSGEGVERKFPVHSPKIENHFDTNFELEDKLQKNSKHEYVALINPKNFKNIRFTYVRQKSQRGLEWPLEKLLAYKVSMKLPVTCNHGDTQ